ncbi:MAG: hypothetical protein D6722_20820 [Bacteroidetes bacterium]|nr:MAG: hypothetical protein D6722_20820 [Bacteroidota bacterium]
MFALSAMAFTICFLTGKFEHARKPIPKKNHGYKQVRFFRKGLDTSREAIRLNVGIKTCFEWIINRIGLKINELDFFKKIVV